MSVFDKHVLNLGVSLPTIVAVDGALAKNGICIVKDDVAYTTVLSSNLLNSDRLVYIYDTINELVDEYKPEYAAIEGYAYGGIGRTFSMAEAGGVFRLALAQKNIPTVEIPPTTLKKYITGKGNADKSLIKKTIHSLFDVKIKTHDEVDAFALAVTGLDYFNNEVSKLESFRDYLHRTCILVHGEHPNTVDDWEKLKSLGIRKDQLKKIAQIKENI